MSVSDLEYENLGDLEYEGSLADRRLAYQQDLAEEE
jgi:hypothetical protein